MENLQNVMPLAARVLVSMELRLLIASTVTSLLAGVLFGVLPVDMPKFWPRIESPTPRLGANLMPTAIFGHPNTICMTGVYAVSRAPSKAVIKLPNVPASYIFGQYPSLCFSPALMELQFATPVPIPSPESRANLDAFDIRTYSHPVYFLGAALLICAAYLTTPPSLIHTASSFMSKFRFKKITIVPGVITLTIGNSNVQMNTGSTTGTALSLWNRHIIPTLVLCHAACTFRRMGMSFDALRHRSISLELYHQSMRQFLILRWSGEAKDAALARWVRHCVEKCTENWRARMDHQKQAYDAQVAKLKAKLSSLDNDAFNNMTKVHNLQKQISDLGYADRTNETAAAKINRLEKELAEMTAGKQEIFVDWRLADTRCKVLEADLQEVSKSKDLYKSQLTSARNQVEALRLSASAFLISQAKITQLTTQLASMRVNYEKVVEDNCRANERIAGLNEELKRVTEVTEERKCSDAPTSIPNKGLKDSVYAT